MTYKIKAEQLIDNTLIDLPASKSLSNRALIMQGLCSSPCHLTHLSDCDDTNVMLKAFSTDKASYSYAPDGARIVDIGAAGTSMRFLTAFFASREGAEIVMTGSERMRQRPISVLVDALRRLGADITYLENEGFPPLRISGKHLEGGPLSIDGSISSQYISALLMIAPTLTRGLSLTLEGDITSVPYIEMTLGMMREFGIESSWKDNVIEVSPQTYAAQSYEVESDWSASSYWYEILALCPSLPTVRLKGLHRQSFQGDSHIADYFTPLGIKTEFTEEGVILSHTGAPCAEQLKVSMVSQPDLAQTVITACCALGVRFEINGLHTLRIKETDRISALENELHKLGFVVTDRDNDVMIYDGTRCPQEANPVIATYEDHRMAMAFAPFALLNGSIDIDNPKVVTKSYPSYWNDLRQIGFTIEEA